MSSTPVLKRTAVVLLPCDDGDDEAFRDGVAISMGDVVVIINGCG